MDALFRNKTSAEIERLIQKVGSERERVLEKFKAKAMALEAEEEVYQCFLSSLPKVDELRVILNNMEPEREYEVIHNINGYTIRRIR